MATKCCILLLFVGLLILLLNALDESRKNVSQLDSFIIDWRQARLESAVKERVDDVDELISPPVLDTLSFTAFLKSCSPACFVIFFDPLSQSYLEAQLEIRRAATLLSKSTLHDRVRMAMVDASRDPYIQYLYAKEMLLSYQAPPKAPFRFSARPRFYPLVSKLFVARGTVEEEYSGAYQAEDMIEFIKKKSLLPLSIRVDTFRDVLAKVDLSLPLIIGCLPVDSGLMDAQYHRDAQFVLVSSIECPLTVFHHDKVIVHDSDVLSLEEFLHQAVLLTEHDEVLLFSKMTPDNSWEFMNRSKFLVILLVDLKQVESNSKVKAMFEKRNWTSISFVECDGVEFGQDFGMDVFPSLVLYDVANSEYDVLTTITPESVARFLAELTPAMIEETPQEPELHLDNRHHPVTSSFTRVHDIMSKLMLLLDERDDSYCKTLHLLTSSVDARYSELVKLIFSIPTMRRTMHDETDKLKKAIEDFSDFRQEMRDGKIEVNVSIVQDLLKIYDQVHETGGELKVSEGFVASPKDNEAICFSNETIVCPVYQDFDRVHESELSSFEFFERYSKMKRPVIISGLRPFPQGKDWTRDYLSLICNSSLPKYSIKASTRTWGGLLDLPNEQRLPLGEFIRTFKANKTRETWYVHDNSVSVLCPRLLEDFIMPRYVVNDLLQLVPFNLHAHSWPSLFVGPKGTESKLHVDSGATSFVMFLVQGQKEWLVYENDMETLKSLGMDAEGKGFKAGNFNDECKGHGNARKGWRGKQNAGDLIFIPGLMPHAVRNTEDIVAWSLNFVDEANYVEHVRAELLDGRFRNVELLMDIVSGYQVGLEDMSFLKFKSQLRPSVR